MIIFLLDPPYEKHQKDEKCQTINFYECSKKLGHPVLLKEYNLLSPNNESSPE